MSRAHSAKSSGMKQCCTCRETMDIPRFGKDKSRPDGLNPRCKICAKLGREQNRKNNIKRCYGLTWDVYNEMLTSQGGLCAICGVEMAPVCVDHCHETGVVRGLLCYNCNLFLGNAKDSVPILASAIQYLSRFEEEPKHTHRCHHHRTYAD